MTAAELEYKYHLEHLRIESLTFQKMRETIFQIPHEKVQKYNTYDKETIYKIPEEIDPLFNNEHREVIVKYGLTNYLAKQNPRWSKLSNEEILEYCYSLFDAVLIDDFPVVKQAQIFEKLVFIRFDQLPVRYEEIISCLFSEKYIGMFKSIELTKQSESIPYSPIVPNKHYIDYLKRLKDVNEVSHLQIPLEDSAIFFKQLLRIWYLYVWENSSIYGIVNDTKLLELQNPFELLDQKQITRKIDLIKNLVIDAQVKRAKYTEELFKAVQVDPDQYKQEVIKKLIDDNLSFEHINKEIKKDKENFLMIQSKFENNEITLEDYLSLLNTYFEDHWSYEYTI